METQVYKFIMEVMTTMFFPVNQTIIMMLQMQEKMQMVLPANYQPEKTMYLKTVLLTTILMTGGIFMDNLIP
ncbi:hypothetical protein D3C85_1532420 [compost metagenome]